MQIPRRKLVVVRQQQEERRRIALSSSSSSFVRLHPVTAQALWRDTVGAVTTALEDDSPTLTTSNGGGWNVKHETATSSQVTSGIEFLPLKIQSENQQEDVVVFASYNGGDIDNGKFFCFRVLFILRKEFSQDQWRISIYFHLKSRTCREKSTVAFLLRSKWIRVESKWMCWLCFSSDI